ncbi:MAG TPA: hypothetical protein VK360_04230 [Acidimicrobiales bacterium]|nr:hypothetical protein [Acidimicrobiales bacterium]
MLARLCEGLDADGADLPSLALWYGEPLPAGDPGEIGVPGEQVSGEADRPGAAGRSVLPSRPSC